MSRAVVVSGFLMVLRLSYFLNCRAELSPNKFSMITNRLTSFYCYCSSLAKCVSELLVTINRHSNRTSHHIFVNTKLLAIDPESSRHR